jgi:hypothetical protein
MDCPSPRVVEVVKVVKTHTHCFFPVLTDGDKKTMEIGFHDLHDLHDLALVDMITLFGVVTCL